MRSRSILLLLVFWISFGYGQEHEQIKSSKNISQLNATFQEAKSSGDSLGVYKVAIDLTKYYRSQAKFDSLYKYQDILIAHFDGNHSVDDYIQSLVDIYFMDRRFGRGDLANKRVKELTPWIDDPRVSMKHKSDIAFLIAGYHHSNGQIDKMLDYQLKSIVYADSITEFGRPHVVTRAQMGIYLQDIGRHAESLDFLTEAEPLMERINYPEILKIQLYETIANAMLKVNDIKTAEQYANKMIQIIKTNEYTSMDHRVAQIKAKIARGKGEYEDALKNYIAAAKLADKKAKNKPSKTINQINAAFMHLRLNDLNGAKSLIDSISLVQDLNDRAQVLLDILWTDYYIKSNNVSRAHP